MKKLSFIFIILFFSFIAYHLLDKYSLNEYLTLEGLKSQKHTLNSYHQENKIIFSLSYITIYIIMAALSIPGAAIMTLAGGMIFGTLWGSVYVSLASSLGATIAFWTARFILKDGITQKFKKPIQTINQGIKKEGTFYLFALRLIPVFPFFLVNLAMGLTSIRTIQFFFVSQIGMLPGTIAYVNAGTQIAQIESLKGIISPQILGAFALLGIIPLVSKWSIQAYRNKKQFPQFKKPRKFDYNIIVIGAGSAGLVSAYIASAVKAKVALIEKNKMGGDCLNTGCVPSKTLIKTAKVISEGKRAEDFGIQSIQTNFKFSEIMEHIQKTIKKIAPHDSVERYTGLGVECFSGKATIRTPYEIEVNGRILTTKNIIIASGGRPIIPDTPGLDGIPYYTSDTIWSLRAAPKHLLIIGAGPIGCELGQSFARLGVKVTIIQRNTQILPDEDSDITDYVKTQLIKENITLYTNTQAQSFNKNQESYIANIDHNGTENTIIFDTLFIAIGRTPNLQNLGLDALGILKPNTQKIKTQEHLSTLLPNIYVCGDALGQHQFTHAAAHHAWHASVNALFKPFAKFKMDSTLIPHCTFTDPEISRIGLNENKAKRLKIPYEVTTYDIRDLDRAITDRDDNGMIKALTVPGKDKILGVTIVGAHAGEVITEFITAMKHNIGLNKILGTIHIYPTHSEANKYLAGKWKKNHAPKKILKCLEHWHTWRRG